MSSDMPPISDKTDSKGFHLSVSLPLTPVHPSLTSQNCWMTEQKQKIVSVETRAPELLSLWAFAIC